MPDITMCNDMNCPLAPKCYRNSLSGTRPNDFRQSYFVDSPRNDKECKHFWERMA